MYAAIVWYSDGITIIKNEDQIGALSSLVNVVGQDGWTYGTIKKGFDDKLSEIMAMKEIDDYEIICDELAEFLDPVPIACQSQFFNHNR